MSPTVIRVTRKLDGQEFVSLDAEHIANASDLQPLTCSPDVDPFKQVADGQLAPALVEAAGRALYQNLLQHPVIGQVLAAEALDATSERPLYIHIRADRAEELPWEALFDPSQPPPRAFLALSRRPIGRIVESLRATAALQRVIALPVRMVAVLSASGIDVAETLAEWERLRASVERAAVERAAAAGIRVALHVLVALPAVEQAIRAAALPDVTVGFITDRDQLLGEIRGASPHLLHFFCHGRSDYGTYLQIATRSDIVAGDPDSILLEERDFEPADIRKSLWAAVLNCCELAAVPASQARSMARSLVNVGIPVVVAMREPIATWVAHTFTECFYESLFDRVRALLATPPQPGEPIRGTIEWADVLSTARARLVTSAARQGTPPAQAARELKEWILPALYTRAGPLTLVYADEATVSKLATLRKYLAEHLLGAPAEVRASIQQEIESLEAMLGQ